MIKYFCDKDGRYLGAFSGTMQRAYGTDGTYSERELWPAFPPGGREVPVAPTHGLQRWNGESWQDTPEMARAAAIAELAESDKRMARVGEDAIVALIVKGVLSLDDLPTEARVLLIEREAARDKL